MKKYEGVLKRVRELEYKKGINYAKPDGALYKTLKVLYTISAIYTILINSIILLNAVIDVEKFQSAPTNKTRAITISIITGLIIVGYILNCFKLYICGAVSSLLPSIFAIPYFWNILQDGFGGVKTSFYWRHLVPLALMIVFIAWLTVLAVRARIKTDRMYKKVSENLYKNYNFAADGSGELSEEEWNEFLENYDPVEYKKQFN